MHAIGEVHVHVTGRPEHHLVAPSSPAVGVRGSVHGARVRLDLGDQDRHKPGGGFVLYHVPKQAGGDIERGVVEERTRYE